MNLTPVQRRRIPRGARYIGDLYSGHPMKQTGFYLGGIWRTAEGFRVFEVNDGWILAESPVIPGKAFRHVHTSPLSAARNLRCYNLVTAEATP